MNRKEFTKAFAEAYAIPVGVAMEVCKVFDFLALKIIEEDKVYIHGLGIFKHKKRKQKRVEHPVTGESIIIPERDSISFTLSTKNIKTDNEEEITEN